MIKQDAVAALGPAALVQPLRVREALKANDRLKLGLTVLQAALAHARTPALPPADLGAEIEAAGLHERELVAWLRGLPAQGTLEGSRLHLPGLERLLHRLGDDLATMARPLADEADVDPELRQRAMAWCERLAAFSGEGSAIDGLDSLTHARRGHGDSLHLVVMDLHKALNRAATRLQDIRLDGAHAWGLAPDGSDAPRVAAFMRGLARTRAAKLDHPGLDTSATRDGDRLLIQNDIGTNDAHVLVLQVEGLQLRLTYADLHTLRFGFFQDLMRATGAHWTDAQAQRSPGLNRGEAFQLGTARWQAPDEAGLLAALEAIGSRIVFLIDWNRARKRLQAFVDKAAAVRVLRNAADAGHGHMAWLAAGGERLLWNAMAAQPQGRFRLGDRLDQVLGDAAAADFLEAALALAASARGAHLPEAYVADELRLQLARHLQQRALGPEALPEHAAWCHALAQGLRDALAHGVDRDPAAALALADRAKAWERLADLQVERMRGRAERHPAAEAEAEARLMQRADDIADALEDACFVLSLIAERPGPGWGAPVREAMLALADAVLAAVQDHVRAVAIVTTRAGADADADADEALDRLWRIVQAERQGDELLRSVRRALVRETRDAAALMLGQELASALEAASDHLLAVGHVLRRRTLQHDDATA